MLNNIGIPGLLLIAVVVLVLFGRGKVSSLMGEVGRGITAFKKGVGEGSREDERDQADIRPREITPPEHGDATPPGPAARHVEADERLERERRG